MADASRANVNRVLGLLRIFIADRFHLRSRSERLHFTWITGFPLLTVDEQTSRLTYVHHPFTRAVEEERLLESGSDDIDALLRLDARAYDLVLNGQEIGGGSVRIHRPDVQRRIFEVLGVAPESVDDFGFLLSALDSGAPPHAGIALGIDRLVMILADRPHIRDSSRFRKTSRQCVC